MKTELTHKINIHGCVIRHAFDNTAARVEFPEGSNLEPHGFTSEPIEIKDGKTVKGEPTATMQAIHAAKAWAGGEAAKAAKATGDKVAAAVKRATAKAEAANSKGKAK